MQNYYALVIPTKPYLKEYLYTLYGNPIYFNHENYFRKVLEALLERPGRTHKYIKEILYANHLNYTDGLEVYLPRKESPRKQTLSPNSIIAINNLFEERFNEDLHKHLELAAIYKVERKKAIEEFCYQHHITIEDQISFGALKKKADRFREKKKKKNKSAQLSRAQTLTAVDSQKTRAHLSFLDAVKSSLLAR